MARYDIYRRLEPPRPQSDLQRGFRAEVHDPAWFLGRQWQLGEHQGEDASSPVGVVAKTRHVTVDALPAQPQHDPQVVPPEAVIESEAGDWWTPGRRLRLGAAYAAAEGLPTPDPDSAVPDPRVLKLPAPYERFSGKAYDGHVLWQTDSAHPVFAGVPADPIDLWDPAELSYSASFPCGGASLAIERHDGGHLDWHSVVSDQAVAGGTLRTDKVLPTRMRYPGAPHPRWWEIENAAVDVGGFPPDRGHFATLLLIDLIVSHSDDWFTFPVLSQAGSVVRIEELVVRDSFDEDWEIDPPAGWSMFQVKGLQDTALLVWPSVASPLTGAIEEEVVLGVDEDANLLWAVELRVGGRDLKLEFDQPPPPPTSQDASARKTYSYRASHGGREFWHPYVLQEVGGRRRFVQGRAVDLRKNPPRLYDEAQATLLRDTANYAADPANQVGPVHQIEPSTLPATGLRLRRRWVLARGTDGEPVVWVQRQRLPLKAPPTSTLRFDVLDEELVPLS